MQAFARSPSNKFVQKVLPQIWRPSESLADAGPPVLFSRIYLRVNMRPKLYKPSHEAHQTSWFKTYLPNLTAFRNSSRRWTTGFIFNDLSKTKYAAKLCESRTKNKPSYIWFCEGGGPIWEHLILWGRRTHFGTFDFVRAADPFGNIWFCKGGGPILKLTLLCVCCCAECLTGTISNQGGVPG